MNKLSSKLSGGWKKLSSKSKGSIVIAFVFIIITVLVSLMSSKPQVPTQKSAPQASSLAMPGPGNTSPEWLAADNQANADQIKKLQEELAREKDRGAALAKEFDGTKSDASAQVNAATSDLAKEVQNLRESLEQLKRSPASGEGSQGSTSVTAEQFSRKKMRLVGEAFDVATPGADKGNDASNEPFLPPGTNFEAIMLNGMDAPTSAVAEKNPEPSTLRVKTDAILPNLLRYNVRECFVVIAGYGVLSSERVKARTETISCAREDGRVSVAKISGYIVGEDGRVGLRGRLVSKQGQVIAQSLAAGVLAGIGMAMTPTATPGLNISPGNQQTYQMPNPEAVAQMGIGRGFSTAANSASQFYLELARSMTPIVEIDAGRKVTIMLTTGVTLKSNATP
jgi:conjugal transfer pilus assembly protein TraB